jgi:hypothetical protein
MAIENRTDNTLNPFIIGGDASADDDGVIFKDAGRTAVLAQYTLLSRIPGTRKWIPFTDETATDGTEKPIGILMSGPITAALIAAADVPGQVILRTNARFDRGQIVIENSKTLNTVIATEDVTVADYLIGVGLVPEYTQNLSELENS